MNIGDRIKEARKKAKLTQEQLAQKCGLATITIRQYESGKREPRFEQLNKIAEALHIRVFDFLSETNNQRFGHIQQYLDDETQSDDIKKKSADIVQILLDNDFNIEIYDRLIEVDSASANAIEEKLENIPEELLQRVLLGSFRELNKRGKYEAVERVAELELLPKYQRTEDPEEKE